MGCVYSKQNFSGSGDGSSRRKQKNQNGSSSNGAAGVELNPSGGGSEPNSPNHAGNGSLRQRIYDVEVCNVEKEGIIHGQLEITDTNLIYRLKGRSPIIWPLRFLRSYGHDKDIFSFECGRRCPTGEGVYVFKCSKAEQLFRTLLDVINSATTLNASNGAINNPGQIAHSSLAAGNNNNNNNSAHEYQNLAPFEGGGGGGDLHGNFGTLPSRLTTTAGAAANDVTPRPHSSVGTAPNSEVQHTYLNSSGLTSHHHHHPQHPQHFHQHVVRGDSGGGGGGGGGKSTTPNYYTQPGTSSSAMVSSTSCQNCSTGGAAFFSQQSVGSTGSRGSLNGNGLAGGGVLGGRRSSASNHSSGGAGGGRDCFDSSSLPPMSRTIAPRAHTYDRKNSEHHLYENHEVPTAVAATTATTSTTLPILNSRLRKLEAISSNMTPSDDQSTFCYVNLDGGAEAAAASSSSSATLASRRQQERQIFLQDLVPTFHHQNPHAHHHHLQGGMSSKSARTTPEPRLSYIQLDLNKDTSTSAASAKTKSESLKVTSTSAAAVDRSTLEKRTSSPLSSSSSSATAAAIISNGKALVNGSGGSKVRKGSGGSLLSSSPLAAVPPSSSSAAATSSSTVPVNGDILKEVSLVNGSHQPVAAPVAPVSIPYAQIDFAKTLALSNSAANHRKL